MNSDNIQVGNKVQRAGLLVVATFLASPYAHNYDMAALSLLLVPFLLQTARDSGGQISYSIIAAAWLIPLLCMPLAALGLPITPLLLVGLLGAIWKNYDTGLKRPC